MATKYRVCNLRVSGMTGDYQFPTRQEVAHIIRDARKRKANNHRIKRLGTLPGQPNGVFIYLAENGINTIIELSSR